MHNKLILRTFLLIVLFLTNQTQAQTDSTNTESKQADSSAVHSVSLNQAKQYALAENKELKQSFIEVLRSDERIWETIASGLPQLDLRTDVSYMLEVPEAVSNFSSFNAIPQYMHQSSKAIKDLGGNIDVIPPPPPSEPTTDDDQRLSPQLFLTLSQLLFSGEYIVGIRASRVYKDFISLNFQKDRQTLVEKVTNAYIAVLVLEENVSIMDDLHRNSQKLYSDTKQYFEEGLVEATEADQLLIILRNIEQTQQTLRSQKALAEYMLKYLLGIDLQEELKLTQQLSEVLSTWDLNALLLREYKIQHSVDYKMLQNNVAAKDLNYDLERTAFLPQISAFYRYFHNFNDKVLTFEPSSMVGVSLRMNLFSSFGDRSKVKQAKYNLDIAELELEDKKNALLLAFKQAKTDYNTAFDTFKNKKENLGLSKKIYEHSLAKFKEGLGSSLALTQTHNQYLQNQTDYYSAISEMIKQKAKLEKILTSID